MQLRRMISIYALEDPRTGLTKYIGQAVNPQTRLTQHCRELSFFSECTPKQEWITELHKLGLKPEMKILKVVPEEEATKTEYQLIKQYHDGGFELLNTVANKEGKAALVKSKTKELLKIFILDSMDKYVGNSLRADTFYSIYTSWWWIVPRIGKRLTYKEFKTCLFELGFIEQMDKTNPMVTKLSGLGVSK